jgi:amino acid transporter
MFLQAGKVVYYAGPGLAVFAYLIIGTVMWSAMACLGEMTALFPVKGQYSVLSSPRAMI